MAGQCGRCGRAITHGSWEDDCNNGSIEMERSSQAFNPLTDGKSACATEREFNWWRSIGHPALRENGAQTVRFEWGYKETYQLCHQCQDDLFRAVGRFFGIPEAADRGFNA